MNENDITVNLASTSKIDSVDFENLTFGTVFTDHMLICDYKQGVWEKPVIKTLLLRYSITGRLFLKV